MRTITKKRLRSAKRVHFYPVDGASYSFDGTLTGRSLPEQNRNSKGKVFLTGETLFEVKRDNGGDYFWCRPSDIIAVLS